MKHGFELHGFFLEPKTAYLEALLYLACNRKSTDIMLKVLLPFHDLILLKNWLKNNLPTG